MDGARAAQPIVICRLGAIGGTRFEWPVAVSSLRVLAALLMALLLGGRDPTAAMRWLNAQTRHWPQYHGG